jgi:hypothetical protein
MVCQQVRDINQTHNHFTIGEENDFKGVVDLVKPSYCGMKKV